MSQHWSELLMTDHETTEKVFEAAQKALGQPAPAPALVTKIADYFAGYVDSVHNHKEEEHLFPLIEARGIPRQGGPLAVMLAEHDESRVLLAAWQKAATAYAGGDPTSLAELQRLFGEYATLLKNHFWKENDILYPMARRVLSADDDAAIVRGIEAVEAAKGPDTRARYYALADELCRAGEVKDLVHGLDLDTLGAILNTLPVELSFVDADDTVRYFSHENETKIFPRTRGAIGMKVQSCHPHKSVHLVNRILADFKAGKRDVAEFWIEMGPRKVHIRYWPVRDRGGRYLGCLETVQDIAPIQKLEGQRRLLDDA